MGVYLTCDYSAMISSLCPVQATSLRFFVEYEYRVNNKVSLSQVKSIIRQPSDSSAVLGAVCLVQEMHI